MSKLVVVDDAPKLFWFWMTGITRFLVKDTLQAVLLVRNNSYLMIGRREVRIASSFK